MKPVKAKPKLMAKPALPPQAPCINLSQPAIDAINNVAAAIEKIADAMFEAVDLATKISHLDDGEHADEALPDPVKTPDQPVPTEMPPPNPPHGCFGPAKDN